MAHDYSLKNMTDAKNKAMKKPRTSTLNFIRQFARSYASIGGGKLGSMVLN